MQKNTLIVAVFVAVWVGGISYYFHARHQALRERERIATELAVKSAAEKERRAAGETQRIQEKLKEHARKMTQAQSDETARALGPGAARQTGLIGPGPLAGEPIPPIIPAAERFVHEQIMTATSLDASPYAVINRQRYRIGDRILIGPDLVLTLSSIEDGFVVFTGDTYKFRMGLTAATP